MGTQGACSVSDYVNGDSELPVCTDLDNDHWEDNFMDSLTQENTMTPTEEDSDPESDVDFDPPVSVIKRKCEQRWTEEVQSKKTLDLYAAVKKRLNEEKYVNDPGDRRGARLKFRFRTRSAGLRAEVGGWKNKEEAGQCVMCNDGEEESVEHVLMYSI